MDFIYEYLESKLNKDIVYLIKKEVDLYNKEVYNNKCLFNKCICELDKLNEYEYYYFGHQIRLLNIKITKLKKKF